MRISQRGGDDSPSTSPQLRQDIPGAVSATSPVLLLGIRNGAPHQGRKDRPTVVALIAMTKMSRV